MGRVMGIDYGERRIGVALSDPTHTIARALEVIQHASREADFEHLAQIANEHEVEGLVIGLPISLDGTEGPQARTVRRWSGMLARALLLPVELWDESLSTVQAQEIVQQRGRPRNNRASGKPQRIDAVAAAAILQSYLDAHRKEVSQENNQHSVLPGIFDNRSEIRS